MSIARHHAEWLSLVEQSGPFLSMPVLLRVLPQGLDAHDPEHVRLLRLAYEEWEEGQDDAKLHRAWVRFVLTQTLELPDEALKEGQGVPQPLQTVVPEHGETLRPDLAVLDGDTLRLLIQVHPPGQDLDRPLPSAHWKASPATRMMELLHGAGCRLGLVTNGEHWMLVHAPPGETTGYASWYASYWLEEPLTLRAFRTLLSARRFFSVPEDETLEAMLKESAANQEEVTDQLGYQVRRAVEVLVQALDKADQDHGRKLLADVREAELYEAALTVMMRLVFLFSAEERGLLLLGDPLYDQHYAVSTLRAQLREAADQHGEEVLGLRLDAWCRLLTTFRAVYAGSQHERLKVPAYGGRLFDPDRFPFLEGRLRKTTWKDTPATPLPVTNRTVLHLLEALQLLQVKVPGGGPAEARKLSFRALDIEQIGHVYEGLLDHTARRAAEPHLGLAGTRDREPEVPLARLEELTTESQRALSKTHESKELVKYLKEVTGRSESVLKNSLSSLGVLGDSVVNSQFRSACGNDGKLWGRVKPFAGLVRRDTYGFPVVIPAGSVYVTAGTDRRTSGTHYTPKSLTEPIVRHTLEPLVYDGPAEGKPKEEWRLRSAKEILALKVCDLATGSGAFLVQACRYLAERLQEAWEEEATTKHTKHTKHTKQEQPAALLIDPHTGALVSIPSLSSSSPSLSSSSPSLSSSSPSLSSSSPSFVSFVSFVVYPPDAAAREVYALRLVAQRCLYGVDRNPLAVEMAKLSLWLLTMAKDRPFEFLDHAIRCGDSLVGVHDLDQLKWFSLEGKQESSRFLLEAVGTAIDEARALRRQLAELQVKDIEDVHRQEALLAQAEEKTERLRIAGDLLIAGEFGSDFQAYALVANHFKDDDVAVFQREAAKLTGERPTFHWPIEFPEVFAERGGFDAFVGNPPFMGGQKITGNLGDDYREYLVRWLAGGKRGSADLCAYFFLRARQLLRPTGALGMLATNTIAQGDTREVGLDRLVEDGCVIPRAVPSRPWPGTASLEVAHVWLRRGPWPGPFLLDNRPVPGITSFLTVPGAVSGKPYRLKANEGTSFIGSYVLGMGFVLEPGEAERLIAKDERNKDVLFPYLNGEDLNSRPDQSASRWVINFFDWPIEKAMEYPDCFRIIEEKVKPERLKNNRKVYRDYWWQYAEKRPALYRTIAGLERVLVRSRVANINSWDFITARIVNSEQTVIVAHDSCVWFTLMQNSFQTSWIVEYASSMRTDVRYTPSDCFETFPFPDKLTGLDAIGEYYHAHRRQIMLAYKQGLTKTYNRFHNPDETSEDIRKLRQLHVEMDQAVAAAYGWTDLDLGHGFHETKQGVRYTISEPARQEVLARLLRLNHERYAEEVAQGLHEKKGKSKATTTGRGRRTAKKAKDVSLFPDGDDEDEPVGQTDQDARDTEESDEEADATGEGEADGRADDRPPPIDQFDTDEVMAAFRQAARGCGWTERAELLKGVATILGYQRVGSKIREALKGHLRAALRRKIVEADGDLVRACAATMDQYDLEDLRHTLCSVMRPGRRYERPDVVQAVARHLGFVRVTDTVLQPIKSAINSAIRQGLLAYEGNVIWREP